MITQSGNLDNDSDLRLRNLEVEDIHDLFTWRNHPDIRKNSFNTDTLLWVEHERWFKEKSKDSNSKIYVACYEDEKIGMVRFDEKDDVIKVSVMLNPDFLGKGLGSEVIRLGKDRFINEKKPLSKQLPNTTCYFDVNNMAELMSSADIGIGASGTSTWERCCVSLPSIVMVLADNQKEIAEELEREGVVVNLGWHEEVTEMDIRDAVQNLLADSDKRRSMGLKGKGMVDGNGAIRVVEKIIFSLETVSE